MNQGRIWCVVNPNHGLPLFLGSVALMSFTVHYAVLSNAAWYKDFYNGVPMTKASVEKPADPMADVAKVAKPAEAAPATVAVTTDGPAPLAVAVKPKTRTVEPAAAAPG